MTETIKPPKVFISYAHEGMLSAQVKVLADWLTEHGVQVITDHPHVNRPPAEGWPAWMLHNIEDADVVLVVATQLYKDTFEKRLQPSGGGRGATYEGSILTDELYQQHMLNTRIFPILPDDGHHDHVPVALRAWNNGHRFNSGNARILDLIREEVHIPTPTAPLERYLLGELRGASDNRLSPREQQAGVIGRDSEIADIVGFLHSSNSAAAVCGQVTGSGGIGKTEVCKAALKQWLVDSPEQRAFMVELNDTSDSQGLLNALGTAVGIDEETLLRIDTLAKLSPYLKHGLYYLDNLENVAESDLGCENLAQLRRLPGIRLLASSRVTLDGVLGDDYPLDRLSCSDALALFIQCWNGDPITETSAASKFVDEQLGGHPLAITLMARLGRRFLFEQLLTHWAEHGTAATNRRRGADRSNSLNICFSITDQLLAHIPGALSLWQFCALFAQGIDRRLIEVWCDTHGEADNAFDALCDHHILSRQGDRYSQLPPLMRYALAAPSADSPFDWAETSRNAWATLFKAAAPASNAISSTEKTSARVLCAAHFSGIEQLLHIDQQLDCLDIPATNYLNNQLRNSYQFSPLAGRALLKCIFEFTGAPLACMLLGDLESRLGNIDQARSLYEQAIEHYKNEQANLGLANVKQSQGDLSLGMGEFQQADQHYRQALVLYLSEKTPMGEAYTRAKLIRCSMHVPAETPLAEALLLALLAAQRSGVESVTQYVIKAAFEACGEDEVKLKALLSQIQPSE